MMQIRNYQSDAITKLSRGFLKHLRQVLCLPTGSGKTVIFSEIVRRAALKGTKCLVITDRIELFSQTLRALGIATIEPQLLQAKSKAEIDPFGLVTIAMVETLKRRIASGKVTLFPDLIIIDEAHKGNFTAILDLFPGVRVIGATATPVGKHFYQYYSNIVANIDIPELIDLGFLAPCKAYQMEEDLSGLKVRAGEYTESSLMEHYDTQELFDGVIKEYLSKANGLKTLVFNVSIKHAENMNQAFLDAGISSRVITSKTKKDEREEILRGFTRGDFNVLNNCGILTTGYDEPSIKCIVLNRATNSLPLFLQCCGRGSRIFPGKDLFLVLDFGLNHTRHGLWCQPREWTLDAPKKKSDKTDVAPVKSCPKCEAIVAASAKECEFCGYVFPVVKKQLKEGVMVEVLPGVFSDIKGKKISQLTLIELAALQRAKKYSHHFLWRVVRKKGVESVREYAKIMEYTFGWVKRQKDDLERCQFTDITIK